MIDPEALVTDYVTAWNEADRIKRISLLSRSVESDIVYIDPGVEVRGLEALCDHIERVRAKRPGARIVLLSNVDLHHNVLRFHWRIALADGTNGATSVDYCELSTGGKLSKIVGFFGDVEPRSA